MKGSSQLLTASEIQLPKIHNCIVLIRVPSLIPLKAMTNKIRDEDFIMEMKI